MLNKPSREKGGKRQLVLNSSTFSSDARLRRAISLSTTADLEYLYNWPIWAAATRKFLLVMAKSGKLSHYLK